MVGERKEKQKTGSMKSRQTRTEGGIWTAVNRTKTDFGLRATDDISGFVQDSKA